MKKFLIVFITVMFSASLFAGCANQRDRSSASSDKTGFNAQYIRAAYSSGVNQSNITVISSKNDFDQFFPGHMSRMNGGSDNNIHEKYTDNFFTDNFLVIVRLIENSGSNRHEVKSVSENGEIVINRLLPQIGTSDMAAWNIIIELNNEFNTRQFQTVIVDVGL